MRSLVINQLHHPTLVEVKGRKKGTLEWGRCEWGLPADKLSVSYIQYVTVAPRPVNISIHGLLPYYVE